MRGPGLLADTLAYAAVVAPLAFLARWAILARWRHNREETTP